MQKEIQIKSLSNNPSLSALIPINFYTDTFILETTSANGLAQPPYQEYRFANTNLRLESRPASRRAAHTHKLCHPYSTGIHGQYPWS